MQEIAIKIIKENPALSATALASLFLSIGIMGVSGSFWAGILALGILMLLVLLGYSMFKYG